MSRHGADVTLVMFLRQGRNISLVSHSYDRTFTTWFAANIRSERHRKSMQHYPDVDPFQEGGMLCSNGTQLNKLAQLAVQCRLMSLRVTKNSEHILCATSLYTLLLFTKLETAEFSPCLATVIFIDNCTSRDTSRELMKTLQYIQYIIRLWLWQRGTILRLTLLTS